MLIKNGNEHSLLSFKFSQLRGSWQHYGLEDAWTQLHRELSAKGIHVKLSRWFSTEWFCPDGHAGIAFPFYLSDPALVKLHKSQNLTVEGENYEELMKLLRHEAGHAIDNIYGLRDRPMRKEIFGNPYSPYPSSYKNRPYSKSYVKHLPDQYAQAHPEEDWAETFAVWLDPNSDWRKKYAGTPALRKLECVDNLLKAAVKTRPFKASKLRVDCITKDETRLKDFYLREKRRKLYPKTRFWNQQLNSKLCKAETGIQAGQVIKSKQDYLTKEIAKIQSLPQYKVKRLLRDCISHTKKHKLYFKKSSLNNDKELLRVLSKSSDEYFKKGLDRILM